MTPYLYSFSLLDEGVEREPGYIFDQQSFIEGIDNPMSEKLWKYIKKNTIDLMTIRGISAPKTLKTLNQRIQESIGPRQLKYITSPIITASTIGETQNLIP